jgi:hypothetical protein
VIIREFLLLESIDVAITMVPLFIDIKVAETAHL